MKVQYNFVAGGIVMNEEILILEQESDTPENWVSNTILERDGKGIIIERLIPDDIEEE